MATPKVTTPRGLVAVTGGSGYIAGYCHRSASQRRLAGSHDSQEPWGCRGSAREHRQDHGECQRNRVMATDLNSDVGWADAVAGADYVLHVASPVPTVDPKSDDELVRPARDGALVLKAARDAGVKRVVMTSSTSAMIFGRGVREKPFTEADWSDETNRADTSPYDRAKTIAERAAWAWHKAEGGGLELVTVNPALVLGPVLGSDFSASIEAVRKLLDGSISALPHFGFNVVDVRDIAALQLLAMTTPLAAGQRFTGSCDFNWMADIAKILKQGLGDKARKVPSISVPNFLVRVIAIFDPVARGRLYELGKRRQVSSEKARAPNPGLDDTARLGDRSRNCQKPSGAGLGLARVRVIRSYDKSVRTH
jgi:dihydroflavonol-4-reductase